MALPAPPRGFNAPTWRLTSAIVLRTVHETYLTGVGCRTRFSLSIAFENAVPARRKRDTLLTSVTGAGAHIPRTAVLAQAPPCLPGALRGSAAIAYNVESLCRADRLYVSGLGPRKPAAAANCPARGAHVFTVSGLGCAFTVCDRPQLMTMNPVRG